MCARKKDLSDYFFGGSLFLRIINLNDLVIHIKTFCDYQSGLILQEKLKKPACCLNVLIIACCVILESTCNLNNLSHFSLMMGI